MNSLPARLPVRCPFPALLAILLFAFAGHAAARNILPSVSITSPTSGASFAAPATITISATATDADGTIAKVEFFVGQTKLGEDTTAPYSIVWSGVAAGSYSLTARATDNAGGTKKSKPVPITVTAADGRATVGEWSPVIPWPDVAIHLHLLPDGTILSYSDDDHQDYPTNGTRLGGKTRAFVVTVPDNPALVNWVEIPNTRTNVFCSGHAFLPDGRLLIVGGHDGVDGDGSTHTTIFDYRLPNPWDYTNPDMSKGRWYPTATSLANGEVLVLSGSIDSTEGTNALPEVWQTGAGGGWRALSNAIRKLPLYPGVHVAPNGRIFVSGPDPDTHYLDTSGAGMWSFVANRQFGSRSYGSSVTYEPGKILAIGGGDPPTSTAEVIDLTAATPAWNYVGSMASARRQLNATVLPDGKVLVTGGTSSSGFNNGTNAVLTAELWNPATGTWSTMASMQVPRLYHSTALLLPDGRVLSAGGGRPAGTGTTDNENAEFFSPPYLFRGTRPTVSSAPATVGYGQTFSIGTPDAAAIASVTLVRLSSVTHAFNMNQRFNRLSFTAAGGGLQATAPANSNLAPPGHYMLFILNGNGVPSVAKIIQLL